MGLKAPLFIHGWAFSSRIFGKIGGIKPDLPAHGGSKEPYRSLEETARSIALSLPAKHDVVGWSLGGTIALLIALLFPQKVERLFLVGTSPFFRIAWSEKNLRAFKLRIRREGVRSFRRMAYPSDFRDGLEEEVALRILEDYINTDLRDRITSIKKRTYILQGEKDPIVPVEEAFKLKTLIKGSKLIILPGGHFPAEDETGLLSTLLKVC
jgi:pimeloyl-[acyl-carrier protein] methyl ester esterase